MLEVNESSRARLKGFIRSKRKRAGLSASFRAEVIAPIFQNPRRKHWDVVASATNDVDTVDQRWTVSSPSEHEAIVGLANEWLHEKLRLQATTATRRHLSFEQTPIIWMPVMPSYFPYSAKYHHILGMHPGSPVESERIIYLKTTKFTQSTNDRNLMPCGAVRIRIPAQSSAAQFQFTGEAAAIVKRNGNTLHVPPTDIPGLLMAGVTTQPTLWHDIKCEIAVSHVSDYFGLHPDERGQEPPPPKNWWTVHGSHGSQTPEDSVTAGKVTNSTIESEPFAAPFSSWSVHGNTPLGDGASSEVRAGASAESRAVRLQWSTQADYPFQATPPPPAIFLAMLTLRSEDGDLISSLLLGSGIITHPETPGPATVDFTPMPANTSGGPPYAMAIPGGMQLTAWLGEEATTKSISLLPIEFITRQSKESETTVAVQGVGLTNQRPTVKLDSVSASNVSISNGMATIQIKGSVRDAIADNVPEGKGADIESVRILVNGEEQDTATVNRQQDGTATAWRQFPCKGVIQPTSVSFAAQGVVTVRVETTPNAAGEVGYDEVQFRFDKQASGGTLVGGGTISYDLQLAGAPQPGFIDTLQAKASAASAYSTLTETAADSNVFASPDGQFVVRLFSTPTLTNQADEISCVVWDASSAHSASGSGGGSASCVETGAATNTFQYTQTIQPIRTGVTYSHTLAEVINAETPDAGGNHPFAWRMSGFGDAAQIKTKLGGATFDTLSYGGSLMPKGTETRHVIAYLLRDAEEENPPLKMLYYDETSQSLITKTISDPAELLKLKLLVNQQETETIKLAQGQMEWRTPSGEPVEDLQKLPAQTLVDFINGDNDIEIDDDSAQVLRVTAINKDSPRVRVRSSEILTDYFELSKTNGSGSKQAEIKEVGSGIFETEQKIIVYESSPGIQTLSESQWQALKGKGYLAVHNLTAEAVQIINDLSLDSKAGEIMQDHHLFNQWAGDEVPPRYKNFWSKVFDPGTFDVDDFTVEVSAKRHARFSNHCTQAWKRIIESVTDASGNLLPTVDKAIVRRTVIETAFEMVELYHLPIERVRRYPPKAPGRAKPALGSKLDDLIRLDEGTDLIRWGDPTDHRTQRWAKYAPRAVKKYGKGILRSMPYLGHAMTAWALINFASNPSAALASELNISQEAAQLLLEGKVCAKLQLWQPNSPVQGAQLSQGSVHIGMTYFYAHVHFEFGRGRYVARVEEGNVVWIETTGKPGFVNLRVRVGQEERLHTNRNRILPGIPEEGKPAPPGW